MKPKQHKVELEIKREEESEYYDKKDDETVLDADEDIANGLAAAKKNRYREILTSTEVPLKTNYAVGVLINNELHITPIQHVLQFRPSFQHLEDSSKKSKKEEKEETETPMDVEDDSGVTPLQVLFTL
jgi:DNA-directed RNA polymerase-3 subunit RPC5